MIHLSGVTRDEMRVIIEKMNEAKSLNSIAPMLIPVAASMFSYDWKCAYCGKKNPDSARKCEGCYALRCR